MTSTAAAARYPSSAPDEDKLAARQPPTKDDLLPVAGLSWRERSAASALGLAGVGVGGVGIFLSENQAGTTAMLILGAVFLLMGVQGTAIRRASKDSVEMEQRARRAQVVSQAEEVLQTEGPEQAEAFIEGASAIDPELAKSRWLAGVRGEIYHSQVIAQLIEIVNSRFHDMFDVLVNHWVDGREYDAVLRSKAKTDNQIVVDLHIGGRAFANGIRKLQGVSGPALLIVDTPLYSAIFHAHYHRLEDANIELVSWQTTLDNDNIVAGISKIISQWG